jgi:hypothetical protein
MSAIKDAAEALRDSVNGLPSLSDLIRATTDLAPNVTSNTAIIGPPALIWEGMCDGPTSARFLVYVVAVPADERAIERLWELVPLVAEAIDDVTDAVVTTALPGQWGSANLPCYELTVEVSL